MKEKNLYVTDVYNYGIALQHIMKHMIFNIHYYTLTCDKTYTNSTLKNINRLVTARLLSLDF